MKAQQLINKIDTAWRNKEISDEKGFIEENPPLQTKAQFKMITIYYKNGKKDIHLLSIDEYSEYAVLKRRMLGL